MGVLIKINHVFILKNDGFCTAVLVSFIRYEKKPSKFQLEHIVTYTLIPNLLKLLKNFPRVK